MAVTFGLEDEVVSFGLGDKSVSFGLDDPIEEEYPIPEPIKPLSFEKEAKITAPPSRPEIELEPENIPERTPEMFVESVFGKDDEVIQPSKSSEKDFLTKLSQDIPKGMTPKQYAEEQILGAPEEGALDVVAEKVYKAREFIPLKWLGMSLSEGKLLTQEERKGLEYLTALSHAEEKLQERRAEQVSRKKELETAFEMPTAEPATTGVQEEIPTIMKLRGESEARIAELSEPDKEKVEESVGLFTNLLNVAKATPEFGRRFAGMLLAESDELALGFGALGGVKKLASLSKMGKELAEIDKLRKTVQSMNGVQRQAFREILRSTRDIRATRQALNLAGETAAFTLPTVLEGEVPTGEEIATTAGLIVGGKVISKLKKGEEYAASTKIKPTKPDTEVPAKTKTKKVPPPKAQVEKEVPEETIRKRKPSFEEYERLTSREERQRIYEENPVTGKPGTPHFQRHFLEASENETKSISAGAGDVNAFGIYDNTLGQGFTDKFNKDIYDAFAEGAGKDVAASNLHGDEYSIVAKVGQNPEELAKQIQKGTQEVAKLKVTILGQEFHPTMKWRIETPESLKKFGDINAKKLPSNTISYYDPIKKTYINIEGAPVKPEQIVTKDKFIIGENGEVSFRKPPRAHEKAGKPAPEEPAPGGNIPKRGKMGVPEREPGVQKAEVEELSTQAGIITIPVEELKSAKSKVPKVVKDAHEDMVSKIQVKEFESEAAINKIHQKLSENERKVIPFIIEETKVPKELGKPELEKIDLKDPKLTEVAKNVKKHFHEGWKYMQDNIKNFSADEIENYVTHIWNIPKNKVSEAVNWFVTRNPFLKKRFFETFEAGIKKGYKPKTLDIAEIMRIHDRYAIRTTEHLKLLDILKKVQDENGIKLIQRADKAPEGWLTIDHPVLRRGFYKPGDPAVITKLPVKYHPDLDPLIQSVFGQRFKAKGLAGSLLKGYETLNAVLKKAQLSFSLFHHAALSETAVGTLGPLKAIKISGNAKSLYNALKNKRFAIYEEMFEPAKDGIENGLKIGAISDVHRGMINNILKEAEESLSRIHKTVGLPVYGLRKANQMWDVGLWDWLHNNLKVYGYETVKTQMIKGLKNPTPQMIKTAKKEAAQFVNDTFGGQNWERMMTNPKTLQMFQWAFLSPDWTLSTIRQALSPTGFGAISKTGRVLRSKAGIKFWAQAGLYFGVGINVLNMALVAADEAEQKGIDFNEHLKTIADKSPKEWWRYTLAGNDPGHKTHLFAGRYPDGSKRYIRWGKQFRELPELIYDAQAGEVSPLTATLKKLGAKTSPALQQASVIFTGKTPSGFTKKELDEETGWKWIGALTKSILKSPLPFAFSNTLDETKEFKVSDLAFPSSKGMTYYKTKKLFKRAIAKEKKQDYIRKIFIAATENDLNASDILKAAIQDLKSEASSELSREIRTKLNTDVNLDKYIENPENYLGSLKLTPKEKKTYGRELVKAAKKKIMINRWEYLINIVDEQIKAYKTEKEAWEKEP